ncbi:MAG TPA: VOC family protein [Dactylosporangium sp.]|jgi:catechol 2,3-dioxygenase-like lactoylglutathione lyase family enzyme|nr:VOC family protein [Dactylosporangium sp.]
MSVQLNHTIVAARDKETSASFLATMLGVPVGPRFGPFIPVEVSNGVTLDFIDAGSEPIASQHYAFLVSEGEFDAIFGRIREVGVDYYADPHHDRPRQINHRDGGRGVYFDDPNGHNLEILTRPYGSGAA